MEWCESKGNPSLPLFETSAMDDINVDAAFYAAAQTALKRRELDGEELYVSRGIGVAFAFLPKF